MYIYRLLRTSLYPLTCPIVRFFQTGALLNSETKIGNTTAKITEEPCRQFKHASLGERSIIRISGSDAISFVQGLITNDVNHLMDNGSTAVSRSCIYTFMLNSSGRIITDLFIYCPNKTDELLLEVDSDLVIRLCSLLKRYKIRRKVEIQHDPTYKISVIYPEFPESCQIVSIGTNVSTVNDKYMIVNDPRCIQIGYRIVNVVANSSSSPSVTSTSIFTDNNEFFKCSTIENVQSTNYRYYRYRLGLGEGSLDFPPESIFPFEANADLLNAISFQKGCYLGQELTARTYHTGVLRKRMVPIQFLTDDDIDLSNLSTQNVISEKKRIIGKFRTNFGKYGLASLKSYNLTKQHFCKLLVNNVLIQMKCVIIIELISLTGLAYCVLKNQFICLSFFLTLISSGIVYHSTQLVHEESYELYCLIQYCFLVSITWAYSYLLYLKISRKREQKVQSKKTENSPIS